MKWGGIGKKQFIGLEKLCDYVHDRGFYKAFLTNLVTPCYYSFHAIIRLVYFCNIIQAYMTDMWHWIKTLYYMPLLQQHCYL